MQHPDNQEGFTLIELLLVAIILSIVSAIAIPIYKGYRKEAHTQEAYIALSIMSDICISKVQKSIAAGGNIGTVVSLPPTKHFSFEVLSCNIDKGEIVATGLDIDNMKDETLIIDIKPSAAPPTKNLRGTLF